MERGERLRGQVAWSSELSRLGEPTRGWAEKLFAGPLEEGWCKMSYREGGSLTLRFSPEQLPYAGLWLCQGGWPGGDRPGHYTAALEPCTAPCDRLDEAVERGYARLLAPGERASWQVLLEVREEAIQR